MPKSVILLVIVLAQFMGTSVWFAGNAVVPELVTSFSLTSGAIAQVTSSVQLGFICGTLVFAIFTISDRFSPVRVFFFSSMFVAFFNVAIVFIGGSLWLLLSLRFLVGVCLAGIYPVGMKIASDHFDNKLGKALGFLVGALVLGTALPHLIKGLQIAMSWKIVFEITSGLAITGGLLVLLLVPDGPHGKRAANMDTSALSTVFRNKAFRTSAFGYFGHMWELYAFWAFLPVFITGYASVRQHPGLNVSLASFMIVGWGSLACIASGYLSSTFRAKTIAMSALFGSGMFCLLSPFSFLLPPALFLAFLVVWGLFVIADSPMFSSMVATSAPVSSKGTALTIVNCIGFSITIFSITLLNMLNEVLDIRYLLFTLAVGPLFGLYALRKKDR